MKILVEEVITSLFTERTVGDSIIDMVAVRPRLYRHLAPAGNVLVRLTDLNDNLIAVSNSRSIAAIGTGNYWHGNAVFTIAAQLRANTTYRFHVVTSGYTFAEAAYLGWVNGWPNSRAHESYSPARGPTLAFDMEIWSYQKVEKGIF